MPEFPKHAHPAICTVSPDLLREATSHAIQFHRPLLRRLTEPAFDEHVIQAATSGDAEYRLGTPDEIDGKVPRRVHLVWLRDQLSNGEAPDELGRAFGDAYVEMLLDRTANQWPFDPSLFSDRTYAQAYGGPHAADDNALGAWLDQHISLYDLVDGEDTIHLIRANSPAYKAFLRAVGICGPFMPWLHPGSGEDLGRIAEIDSMMSDGTLYASSAVAVSCLQWTADLNNCRLRVEVVDL